MSGLYEWVPVSRGQPIPSGAVMSGHTKTDGDVYVGRNHQGEVGKVNLNKGVMYNIWCHSGGDSPQCELLVLRPGSTIEWRPYKTTHQVPDGAVWAGVTKTDGRHGVYVGRDKHGACGKINLTDDGRICNLWIHSYWSGQKEGEILLVNGAPGAYVPGPAPAVPFVPSAPPAAAVGVPVAVPIAQAVPVAGGWNPNAMCDGKRAEERAIWLEQNQGLTLHAAQQQVMREFPAQFQGGGAMGGMGGGYGGGMPASPHRWAPNAMCDGTRAEERANWLQQNKGMTMHAAREQIMREFPTQFAGGMSSTAPMASPLGGWNPNAICDGKRAEERAIWLQQNEGLTIHAAQQQVMREFPQSFAGGAHHHHHGAPMWNPNAICDGKRAEERALWLQQNQRLSPDAARQQVMREFPQDFGGGGAAFGPMWNPNAMCDGSRAEERAVWLQQNSGLTVDASRQQIMREFPAMFR